MVTADGIELLKFQKGYRIGVSGMIDIVISFEIIIMYHVGESSFTLEGKTL